MRRLAGIALALAVLGALVAAGPASAWERKESQWWVWYVPNDDWNAAQSSTTIDITSPTGALYVGVGFSSWPEPVTHREVIRLMKDHDAFDPHRYRDLHVGHGSKAVVHDTVSRRKYKWSAYRTGRKEAIKGRLTVDVIRDDSTATYGWAVSNRSAPADGFGKQDKKLRRIERNVRFKPRTPEFDF